MYINKFAPKGDNTRLYDLLVQFQQGNESCFQSIIKRFSWMINKASYNSYIGTLDDDLRSEIYLTLFLRLRRFAISDMDALN